MIRILCLDDSKEYGFNDKLTPYEAMKKMLYTLNLASKDDNAVIQKTETDKTLYFEHKGKTYATPLGRN